MSHIQQYPRYSRPDGTSFHPTTHKHTHTGSLPDGCAYVLLLIVSVFAVAVFLALAVHPQGIDLFRWFVHHR